ncbi:hypothetical protein L6452_22136 [Arctium lappa]|uniref:Uncharacterized protein n=1 Tax=Arctium lappa TaxID=4217 RepID=A0ACB9B085_ARCLA|nr:hypothetical protein L6452_22136 [Arctium lappa]
MMAEGGFGKSSGGVNTSTSVTVDPNRADNNDDVIAGVTGSMYAKHSTIPERELVEGESSQSQSQNTRTSLLRGFAQSKWGKFGLNDIMLNGNGIFFFRLMMLVGAPKLLTKALLWAVDEVIGTSACKDNTACTSACKDDIACTSACNTNIACTSACNDASASACKENQTNGIKEGGVTQSQSTSVGVDNREGVMIEDQVGELNGGRENVGDREAINEHTPKDLGEFLEDITVNVFQADNGKSDQQGLQKEGIT